MTVFKRLLYQTHRWVGVALALFMLLWFISGLIIMYAGGRSVGRAEQLHNAEILMPRSDWLSLGEAWSKSVGQQTDLVSSALDNHTGIIEGRLVRLAGEPVWLIEDSKSQHYAVSASDGNLFEITESRALKIALQWLSSSSGTRAPHATYVELADSIMVPRNRQVLAPFHRLAVNDVEGRELLISARTGEVVSDNTRLDRVMFLAGNWIHLLKPLDSIGLGDYRKTVQLWLGLSAAIACLTGLIIGWLRWRPGWFGRPTYSKRRTHPYRDVWNTWHFWSGLMGGTLATTWAFSGFIDTNPGQLFSQAQLDVKENARYLDTDKLEELSSSYSSTISLPTDFPAQEVVELVWRHLSGESLLLAYTHDGRRLAWPVNGGETTFSHAALVAGVKRIAKDSQVAAQTLLNDYDDYYYPRHNQTIADKPLPVLRVELDDPADTHFYLDPQDGKVLARLDRSARVFRWLYSALHHWDFGWLYKRPIWDVWLLTGVLLGVVLGFTAVILGWKRLAMTFRVKKKPAYRANSGVDPKLQRAITRNGSLSR